MKQIKFLLVATIVLVALVAFRKPHPKTPVDSTKTTLPTHKNPPTHKDPPCLQMYYHIERYADSFKIPKRFAYGIAKSESGYNGPFHWKYNHAVSSGSGAYGPMQLLLSTAYSVNKEKVTAHKLRNDIDYNVMTSMKLLRKLNNKYKDWKTTFGAYNSGHPCINGYAIKIYNHTIQWR